MLETDGFVLDRVIARGNDEYGILAFASDHGLIQHSERLLQRRLGHLPRLRRRTSTPTTQDFKPTRYAIEIRYNRSHDNTLGYSGTAGNSIHAHDNGFYDNATGIATDSLFPGHPGLPQDHARWDHNRIFSNNSNYYTKYVDTGRLRQADGGARLHRRHRLPGRPRPGRHRRAHRRRQLQLHRPQLDLRQLALRHHAVLGAGAAARRVRPRQALRHLAPQPHLRQPHGLHAPTAPKPTTAWTTGGTTRATATAGRTTRPRAASRRTTSPCRRAALRRRRLGLHARAPRSRTPGFLSCSQYDRNDPDLAAPAGCNWFDSPPKPTDESGDPFPVAGVGTQSGADASESLALLAILPLVGTGAALRLRGRSRRKSGRA